MTDHDDPDEFLLAAADRFVSSAERSLGGWAERALVSRAPQLAATATTTAAAFRAEVVGSLRRLVDRDIDDQRATPLQLLRASVPLLTAALVEAGVEARPGVGDRTAAGGGSEDSDDPFGIAPASWADVGEDVGEAAMVWGAAKAMVHLERRRRE